MFKMLSSNGIIENGLENGDENVVEDENGGSGGGIIPETTEGGDDSPPEPCTISSEVVGTICDEADCIGEMIGECCIGVCIGGSVGFTECFNTCVQQGIFTQAECEVLCSPS